MKGFQLVVLVSGLLTDMDELLREVRRIVEVPGDIGIVPKPPDRLEQGIAVADPQA